MEPRARRGSRSSRAIHSTRCAPARHCDMWWWPTAWREHVACPRAPQPFPRCNVFSYMRRLERTSLFDTPAGFDEPLEVLVGCHRRIERQLETLKRLRAHVEAHGIDADATTAAQSILAVFHAGRDQPSRRRGRRPLPDDRAAHQRPRRGARFRAFRESLEADHRKLESSWSRLSRPLEGISDGLTRALPAEDVHAFADAYARHIIAEESMLKEFVDRWLDDGDRQMLGRAMAARRGVQAPKA